MSVRDPLGAAVAWLSRPLSVLGLLLLLLNDHVLKQAWPGTATGKLSDLAGMLMFPPLLAVLMALALPMVRGKTLAVVALCLTGGGFAAIKFFWYGAELASAALTIVSGQSLVRADPADLVVLPALWLSWRSFQRASVRGHDFRPARLLVLLPLALLGTAATSCAGAGPFPPPVLGEGSDGSVWLRSVSSDGDVEYSSTADGGLTFREARPGRAPAVREQDCAGRTCYRVVRGRMLVQQRVGSGAWTTAWELSAGHRRDLVANAPCDDPDGKRLESQSLVVIPRSNGHLVLVSNGDDGLLRRDVSGAWTRIGWGAGVPPRALSQEVLPGGGVFFSVAIVVLILLIGGLGGGAITAGVPWVIGRWALLFVLVSGVAIGLDMQVLAWGDTAHPAFVVGSAAASVTALAAGALFLVLGRRLFSARRTAVMVTLVACLAWLNETLRHSSTLFLPGLFGAAVVVMGFAAVAVTGLGIRGHPRQTG